MSSKPESTPLEVVVGLDGPLMGAFEEMPVPMWVADCRGHIRWLNRKAVSMLGPAVGSHFSRYFAPDRVADAREMFARKLEGHVDSEIQRTTLMTTRGSAVVELASVPIRHSNEVVGVIALARDEKPGRSARRRPRPRLTPRQQEVLELLADGRSTAEMSERLNISKETVRNHVRHLLTELRVKTRLEAVVTAFKNEWV